MQSWSVSHRGDENTCLAAGVGTGVAVALGVGVMFNPAVGVAELLPGSAAMAVPTEHDKKMVARTKIANFLSFLNTLIPPARASDV
jgi:hypothetical protein